MDALHELQLAITRDALDDAPAVTSRTAVARTWTEEDLAGGPLTAVWEGYLWVRTFPGAASFSVQSPGNASIEIDGVAVALNEDGRPSAPVNLTYGERRVRVVAQIDRPGDTSIGYAIDGTETTLARAAYGISTGASGFQAIFRDGVEFVAEPAILTHIPFALGVSVARNFQAVEYRGTFDTSLAGDYRYALEGASSSQVYIDDQLIIDNGGAHGSRRVEGTATLTTGEHLMTITYLAGDIADWAVYVRDPDADFRQLDGSEFRPPTGEYKPPVLAVVRADPVWGSLGQPVDGLETAPNGIAALPDGTIVIGYGKTLAFADRVTGRITRSVIIDADAIVDIAAGPDGRIVVLDSQRRSLILLSEDGEEQRRIDAAFQSASGVAVRDNTAYVASAAGGLIYAVPLDTLEPEVISGKPEDFVPGEERAQQPSDIVVGDDGTVYANDFERVRVLAYREGKVVSSFPGVTGSGGQVPRMAYHRGLILITDPQNTRLVVYDVGGRLRGAFTFQLQEKVARVIGIEATDDGSIFVAAAERGVIFRLRLEISPELEALIGVP
jgi:sugar lactone lactonase YvrE